MRSKVPHALSLSRVPIAVAILLLSADPQLGSVLMIIALSLLAMMTDWADGFLARKWGLSSPLGYVLDAMGDRAIHLALVLVILVWHPIHPVFAWLLIFRDICIYAVRLLSSDWLPKSRQLQWISRSHATLVRVWLGSYLLADALKYARGTNLFESKYFVNALTLLLLTTLVLSYWGLGRSLKWVLEQETASHLKAGRDRNN